MKKILLTAIVSCTFLYANTVNKPIDMNAFLNQIKIIKKELDSKKNISKMNINQVLAEKRSKNQLKRVEGDELFEKRTKGKLRILFSTAKKLYNIEQKRMEYANYLQIENRAFYKVGKKSFYAISKQEIDDIILEKRKIKESIVMLEQTIKKIKLFLNEKEDSELYSSQKLRNFITQMESKISNINTMRNNRTMQYNRVVDTTYCQINNICHGYKISLQNDMIKVNF